MENLCICDNFLSSPFYCYSITPSITCHRMDNYAYEIQSSTITGLCIVPSFSLHSPLSTANTANTAESNSSLDHHHHHHHSLILESDRSATGFIGFLSIPEYQERSFQTCLPFHIDHRGHCQLLLNSQTHSLEYVIDKSDIWRLMCRLIDATNTKSVFPLSEGIADTHILAISIQPDSHLRLSQPLSPSPSPSPNGLLHMHPSTPCLHLSGELVSIPGNQSLQYHSLFEPT